MGEHTVLHIAKLAAGLTTAALVASSTMALSPVAAADPAIPLDPGQLPGLEAVQSLSPVVQQAAANPSSAQQLLLAAASQLAGNATTPDGSLALAQQVTKFIQEGGAAGILGGAPAAAPTEPAAGIPHGTTPLMMAAHYGNADVTQLLLEEGADLTLKNQKGLTAYDFAYANPNKAALALITKALQARPGSP